MGKGGVGKTTIAAAIALGLHRKGRKVRLATTDPADHLNLVIGQQEGISVSHIDEKGELKKISGRSAYESAPDYAGG